jgi:hypothetical protein
MTREDIEYYEGMFSIFSENTWREFIEEKRNSIEVLKNTLVDERDSVMIYRTQGRIDELNLLVNLEQTMRDIYDASV